MPDSAAELLSLYDAALDLTRRQARAIQQASWEELLTLLKERGEVILKAEALLARTRPSRPEALAERIQRLAAADALNEQAITRKRRELESDLHEVETTREALSGYLDALKSPVVPHFFDRDQ